MQVAFKRTGARRYAVLLSGAGISTRAADPAPGYDHDIPHDLVHYVVEAELGLDHGVYGRAARGAGTFIATAERDNTPRQRARAQRKQLQREHALRARAGLPAAEMATSERIAALSDVAWRRKSGQRPDGLRSAPALLAGDAARVARVVARLDTLAPLWRALPVNGELVFEWPQLEVCCRGLVPVVRASRRSPVSTSRSDPSRSSATEGRASDGVAAASR